MKKTLSLTNKDGEVRELTADDLRMFKSAKEVLPPSLQKKLGVRGPQKAPKKIAKTIRLSAGYLKLSRQQVMVGKLGLMHHFGNLLSNIHSQIRPTRNLNKKKNIL